MKWGREWWVRKESERGGGYERRRLIPLENTDCIIDDALTTSAPASAAKLALRAQGSFWGSRVVVLFDANRLLKPGLQ